MFISSSFVFAGETDLLIQKLIENGTLNAGDGQVLLTQTKEEMKKSIAQGKADNMPAWVQNLSLKGDIRVRYQTDQVVNAVNRDRARLRLRIGAVTRMQDGWSGGFGLATGARKTAVLPTAYAGGSQVDIVDGEPRSTNATFGDMLSKPALMVDYGYIQYEPNGIMTVKLGKFSNPIWQATDLLWDGDLNPDGVSVPLTFKINSGLNLFFTPSYFILDEISAANDPGLLSEQLGCDLIISETLSLKAAVAAYQSQFVKGGKLDNSAKTNTNGTAALRNDYNAVNPSLQLNMGEVFGYSLSIFGDFVTNPSTSTANAGSAIGIVFGAPKVASAGDWQVKALSRYLETDAFLDTLPDSDSYGGATNCKGYELIISYGLSPNVSLGIDYYSMDKITGASSTTPKSLTQVDLVLKF